MAMKDVIVGCGGEVDPASADEYAPANAVAGHLYRTLLLRTCQQSQDLIQRHEAQIPRKRHLSSF